MKSAEIRSAFLRYFEKNGHAIVESSSLVPSNDPTLLFTNAGMVQFKDVFLGRDRRTYSRATTSQKCVRAGGKHNDLENVGFTARHHTFFEMLGNFSFGDYFKKEAVHFAWEFLTRDLGLPKDKLYVTVFEKDDEAADLWHRQEGVPRERIFRLGEKDNFWMMGETGPCGPCSEIYIDRGAAKGCGRPSCNVGCDCDRYMEFWNLVFMQFDRDAGGKLTPLPKPSVDTGMGLERISTILQNVDSNYETDGLADIILGASKLAGREYRLGTPEAASFRVIADHSRATAFLIGDGVMPSNEGRGYVLRRIIRRAIRHGKKLGFGGPFLHRTSGFVIDQMRAAYPDLEGKRAFIDKVVLSEEEQFLKTLEKGLALLDEEMGKLGRGAALAGESAFKLYDTFGFPLDLTRVILTENGFALDEGGFERAMDRQRAESRKSWKGSGQERTDEAYLALAAELRANGKLPRFDGYGALESESECLAILVPGEKGHERADSFAASSLAATADSADAAPTIELIFAATPFYGESGGQVGDQGRIESADFEGDVIDAQKPVPDLIVARVQARKGVIRVGARYRQLTDRARRALTARNHTATHLLHWALRETLGAHVKQAGSQVSPELLRFDFSHFQQPTREELARVETMVNERIWSADPVVKREMAKEDAIREGAIAFFGEKYGETVRVVRVGDYSTELCGGTHVDSAGEIQLFKIVSEGSVAAGVRRITALTSRRAFEFLREQDETVAAIRERLRSGSAAEALSKLDKLLASEKDLRKQAETAAAKAATGQIDPWIRESRRCRAGRVAAVEVPNDPQGMKLLRELAERIRAQAPDLAITLAMREGERCSVVVTAGAKLAGTVDSARVLRELLPLIEGKGGGKADLAQAGGSRASGVSLALERGMEILLAALGGAE